MRIEATRISARDLGRDRRLGRVALIVLWAAGITYIAMAGHDGAAVVCGAPFLLLAGTSLIVGFNLGRSVAGSRTEGSRGRVLIEDGWLTIRTAGGAQKWRREDVVSGWSERSGEDDLVVLAMRSGLFIRFLLPPSQRARDVLQAAGVAPDQRAVVIRLGLQEPGLWRAVMVFFGSLLGLVLLALVPLTVWMIFASVRGFGVSWLIPAVIALWTGIGGRMLYTGLVRPLVPSTVRIGTDGVSIERFFRKHVFRRGDFDRVVVASRQVELWHRGATLIQVPASSEEEAQAVAACITDSLAEVAQEDVRPALREKLERGDRRLDVWLGELRAFAKASSGYREAAAAPRELLGVAKSGAAPAEQRIAAAAALAEQGDPRMRIELLEAAAACADERLRAALEKAAEGEIEEEYMESLAAERAERSRRHRPVGGAGSP